MSPSHHPTLTRSRKERDLGSRLPARGRERGLALLLLAAAMLGGCARGNDSATAHAEAVASQPAAVPVSVAPVSVQRTERLLKFVGTLFGDEEVTLSALVEGQVKAMHVDLGDHIEAGTVLAEINDDRLQAQRREIEANLAKARADEARGRQLVRQQVISPQEFEAMQTRVAVAEAQLDRVNVLIGNAVVRAPLSGSVARRLASAGEYARPGMPLYHLVADDQLKLRGNLPERFAPELLVGQAVQIRVDAHPDSIFPGRLTRISPSANRENRSIAVEAVVPNQARRLKPGFFANASIVTRADDEALMVPETAVLRFAGVSRLFVVQDNVARQREIDTGTRGLQGLIEIVAGVEKGDVVVTSGLTKLEDGTPVTIQSSES